MIDHIVLSPLRYYVFLEPMPCYDWQYHPLILRGGETCLYFPGDVPQMATVNGMSAALSHPQSWTHQTLESTLFPLMYFPLEGQK